MQVQGEQSKRAKVIVLEIVARIYKMDIDTSREELKRREVSIRFRDHRSTESLSTVSF
jgi:predicted HTH domain antitoxin